MARFGCETMVNMLGQEVCRDANRASGYYLESDETRRDRLARGDASCPTRAGEMVISGIKVPTCSGKIATHLLPDIHLVNWPYRTYVVMAMAMIILILLGAVAYNTFK